MALALNYSRVLVVACAVAFGAVATAQVPVPVPRPAPPTEPKPPEAKPPAQKPQGQVLPPRSGPETAPTEASLGLPIYPNARFITSYDAGQGQRYYLFGSTAPFADVVGFYKNALRQKGDLVFEEPATHMFEVGRFKEDTMAFPPGVTVKDYTWGGSQGYLNPVPGAQPARFPTVIQIVPVQGE